MTALKCTFELAGSGSFPMCRTDFADALGADRTHYFNNRNSTTLNFVGPTGEDDVIEYDFDINAEGLTAGEVLNDVLNVAHAYKKRISKLEINRADPKFTPA